MLDDASSRRAMTDDYLDFEIHVHPDRLLTVTVEPGDRRATTRLPNSGPLDEADLTDAIEALAYGRLDEERSRRLGSLLFDWMFTDDVATVYGSVRATGQPVRYRLIVEPPELAKIPWELLYDPSGKVFLALDGPFVRGLTMIQPSQPLQASLPLRLLLVDAVPVGSEQLEVDVERDAISEAFGDLGRKAEVVSLSKASLPAIQNALREAEAEGRPFHALHFMGHGRHDPESGNGAILLEDRWGRPSLVDAASLAEILRPYDLRLVFLNACETADVSAVEITGSFAPALLQLGIPAVIGMQTIVFDEVARHFSQDFYEALVDNRPVDAALADARRLARGTDPARPASLGIPVAYLRSRHGRIAQMIEPEEPKPPWWRSVGVAVAGVLGFIASAIAIWQFIIPLIQGPEPMAGDINVAVTMFAATDTEDRSIDSPDAVALSHQVFDVLRSSLTDELSVEGFVVAVRGPDEAGTISGGSRERRAERAAELAEKIRADVIIYGIYRVGPGVQEFQPEFYLSDRTLSAAEELVGQYELGRKESLDPNNIISSRQFRENMVARTRALSRFIVGLGHYALFQYDEAREWFEGAHATPGWDERDGKEILLLFLGNTLAKVGDYDVAESYYADALAINPNYSRAHIGVADIAFQRGRKGFCPPGDIDMAAMTDAIAGFERARQSTFQPPLADIEAKVSFGLGRVYLCQLLAGFPVSGDVEAQFRRVVEEFESGNHRLVELASESWANLGLVHLHANDLTQAATDYEKAVDLALDPRRRGILECNLGSIYLDLGRFDEAVSVLEAGLSRLEDDPLRASCQLRLDEARQETA